MDSAQQVLWPQTNKLCAIHAQLGLTPRPVLPSATNVPRASISLIKEALRVIRVCLEATPSRDQKDVLLALVVLTSRITRGGIAFHALQEVNVRSGVLRGLSANLDFTQLVALRSVKLVCQVHLLTSLPWVIAGIAPWGFTKTQKLPHHVCSARPASTAIYLVPLSVNYAQKARHVQQALSDQTCAPQVNIQTKRVSPSVRGAR